MDAVACGMKKKGQKVSLRLNQYGDRPARVHSQKVSSMKAICSDQLSETVCSTSWPVYCANKHMKSDLLFSKIQREFYEAPCRR